MNFARMLRFDLAERAHKYADVRGLPYCLSYGEPPTVCFHAETQSTRHGNFVPGSYKAILGNPAWLRRLQKVHTQGRRSLPAADHGRWRELDTCASSDALLMNIFCHPTVSRDGRLAAHLGAQRCTPCFGYKARVPLANGRFDRTEIDLRLGDLLIEAKLTESDFQSVRKSVLLAYRDFATVFDAKLLPQTANLYRSYQLLRNVLAAYALQCSFCVLLDARRPDLISAWYSVMKSVMPIELRTRLRLSSWQELAFAAPPGLRAFLKAKYGIEACERPFLNCVA